MNDETVSRERTAVAARAAEHIEQFASASGCMQPNSGCKSKRQVVLSPLRDWHLIMSSRASSHRINAPNLVPSTGSKPTAFRR
jgi:hypothetical protein